MSGTVIGVLISLGGVVAVLAIAAFDNRRLSGRWFPRRRSGRFRAPDPHDPLTDADRDAWFGGSGHGPL